MAIWLLLIKVENSLNVRNWLTLRWYQLKLIIPPLPEGGGGYTVLPLSVLPSVQDIAELDYCQIIILSIYVPSIEAPCL